MGVCRSQTNSLPNLGATFEERRETWASSQGVEIARREDDLEAPAAVSSCRLLSSKPSPPRCTGSGSLLVCGSSCWLPPSAPNLVSAPSALLPPGDLFAFSPEEQHTSRISGKLIHALFTGSSTTAGATGTPSSSSGSSAPSSSTSASWSRELAWSYHTLFQLAKPTHWLTDSSSMSSTISTSSGIASPTGILYSSTPTSSRATQHS